MSDLTDALDGARRTETEQRFGLRKVWVDPGPGIELVQVHHTCTRPGEEPDWEAAETRVLTPHETAPGLRTAVIEVPRHFRGSTHYLLHHFFFVVRGTEWTSSPVFTEEIVPRDVIYAAGPGWIAAGLGWGVSPGRPELAAPNYTAAVRDGQVFRASVGGPRGFDVHYVVHLVGEDDDRPGESTERWDDAGGPGWTVSL